MGRSGACSAGGAIMWRSSIGDNDPDSLRFKTRAHWRDFARFKFRGTLFSPPLSPLSLALLFDIFVSRIPVCPLVALSLSHALLYIHIFPRFEFTYSRGCIRDL